MSCAQPQLAHYAFLMQVGRLTLDMASRGREVHYMPSHSGAGCVGTICRGPIALFTVHMYTLVVPALHLLSPLLTGTPLLPS